MKVPIVKPDIGELERKYLLQAFDEGEIGVKSRFNRLFEEKLAEYTGFKYAVFCNSGWSALLLAARAANRGKYILPNFTMIATATAPLQARQKLDIRGVNERGLMEGDFNEAVISVDIYGKMPKITAPFIIEDAAEIFGRHKYYGDIVCFSFFFNKIMTVGEGGACVTNDSRLYEQMKLYRHHYYDGKSYDHLRDGYNVSQSGLQAAIGLAQLERIDELLEKRRKIGERYVKELGAWECTEYWYQPLIVKDKEKFKKFMDNKDIEVRDMFNPMNKQPCLINNPDVDFKLGPDYSQQLFDNGILLPMYSAMTQEEQDYIIKSVKGYEKA